MYLLISILLLFHKIPLNQISHFFLKFWIDECSLEYFSIYQHWSLGFISLSWDLRAIDSTTNTGMRRRSIERQRTGWVDKGGGEFSCVHFSIGYSLWIFPLRCLRRHIGSATFIETLPMNVSALLVSHNKHKSSFFSIRFWMRFCFGKCSYFGFGSHKQFDFREIAYFQDIQNTSNGIHFISNILVYLSDSWMDICQIFYVRNF